jgi:hypothetical protein
MVGQGSTHLVDVGAVDADCFVEDLAGDVELLRPVGDVGGELGVDLVGVVGTLGVLLVEGVGLVGLGCVVMLGHAGSSFRWVLMVGCGWVIVDGLAARVGVVGLRRALLSFLASP